MGSFQDDYNKNPKPLPKNTGLKINNSNSTVATNKKSTAEFDEKVQTYMSNDADYKKRTMELAIQFKKMVQDKTLETNRTQIVKNVEGELLKNLDILATQMNMDENLAESAGSTSLCMILMKMLLIERDERNNVAFKAFELEKKLNELSKEILSLKSTKNE